MTVSGNSNVELDDSRVRSGREGEAAGEERTTFLMGGDMFLLVFAWRYQSDACLSVVACRTASRLGKSVEGESIASDAMFPRTKIATGEVAMSRDTT